MSKKFTEKQYNMLVEIQEDQYSDDLFFESKSYEKSYENSIAYTVAQKYDFLRWFIDTNDLGNEAVALMNPLTREWAHDKFVEKENKYYWTSKKRDLSNAVLTLHKDSEGMVLTSFRYVSESNVHSEDRRITESEIKAWGYNPEMFDKEEV